jgi:2-hydroxychromene-2-carboxylate isomerase
LELVKRVELHYDFSCPYAYIASTQIEALCERVGAELVWKPMLLGGVFRAVTTPGATGAPPMPPPKARLNLLDMNRWADWYGVPLEMPPTHPNRTVLALRTAIAAGPELPQATRALYRAYWALGRDVSKPEVVREALDDAGLDGADLLRRAEEDAVKDDLRARTDEAVARGVFGAPTMFVTRGSEEPGGEPRTDVFWGQDRLHLVEAALGGELPAPPPDVAMVPGRVVDFFFDFSSPFAYLASTQIEQVARRAGARVRWRPFLLGALFKAVGTPDVPLFAMPAAKQALAGKDMMRWAAHYGVTLAWPSRFPMSTVKALRMVLQVPDEARPALVHALYRAAWVEDRDLNDDAGLAALATSVGYDGAALVAGTKGDSVKALLKQATDEAVAAGLCGAPSFLVGDLLFWGQDRLGFVERALTGWRPRGE